MDCATFLLIIRSPYFKQSKVKASAKANTHIIKSEFCAKCGRARFASEMETDDLLW